MREIWKNRFKKAFEKFFRQNSTEMTRMRLYVINGFIGLVVVVLVALMLPRGKSYQFGSLKEGEVYLGETIIAPFTFAINKTDEEYQKDIEKARGEVCAVFIKDDSVCENRVQQMTSFFDALNRIINDENIDIPVLTNRLAELLRQHKINPDENILRFFERREFKSNTGNGERLFAFKKSLEQLMRDPCGLGILNLNKNQIKSYDNKISILKNNEESIATIGNLQDMEMVKNVVLEQLRKEFIYDEQRINTAYRIFINFLSPNLFFDNDETEARIKEAIANVPRAKGMILENEKIIDTYERVNTEHIAKLNSLAIEMAEREAGTNLFYTLVRNLGKLMMIMLGLSILVVFLQFNRPQVLKETKQVILIAMIILLVTFFSFFINKFIESSYLFPITIGSMLLTIFFDTKLGFVGTITLSILLGAMKGNEYIVSVVSILAGTAAVLSVAKVRSRVWFLRSIAMITVAYLISITTIEILKYTSFSTLLKYWSHGVMNGFFSPLLTYGLQVVFEYIFDVTTDLRLLDLSDLNRPLLRRLAVEAPGTYHHSIMVANLAESAAEAIGADTLLARVGAYYHDIGKIEKPEYFIENIQRSKNPHEKLSPNMSSLILANHVKMGLELADKYKLPSQIKLFIPEHHGTNVMTYFYHKALEKNKNGEIDVSTFRYPGPKPHSKETGIVMLADGVEAASRTLKDPSASRIKGMVASIVQERFKEFELDECPLTLRDLNRIVDSFATVLLGTFHARVEYPNQEELFFPKNIVKEKTIENKD